MPTDPDQINANQDEEKQASASGKPTPKVQDNENLADDTADLMTAHRLKILLPIQYSSSYLCLPAILYGVRILLLLYSLV